MSVPDFFFRRPDGLLIGALTLGLVLNRLQFMKTSNKQKLLGVQKIALVMLVVWPHQARNQIINESNIQRAEKSWPLKDDASLRFKRTCFCENKLLIYLPRTTMRIFLFWKKIHNRVSWTNQRKEDCEIWYKLCSLVMVKKKQDS